MGEISFYVVYLLVFTLLMNSFSGLSASLLSMLAWITEFMKELSPVYFMAVAAASGASSAAAFLSGSTASGVAFSMDPGTSTASRSEFIYSSEIL